LKKFLLFKSQKKEISESAAHCLDTKVNTFVFNKLPVTVTVTVTVTVLKLQPVSNL
jgi:hypothetical protein